jgi:hypothetical protein
MVSLLKGSAFLTVFVSIVCLVPPTLVLYTVIVAWCATKCISGRQLVLFRLLLLNGLVSCSLHLAPEAVMMLHTCMWRLAAVWIIHCVFARGLLFTTDCMDGLAARVGRRLYNDIDHQLIVLSFTCLAAIGASSSNVSCLIELIYNNVPWLCIAYAGLYVLPATARHDHCSRQLLAMFVALASYLLLDHAALQYGVIAPLQWTVFGASSLVSVLITCAWCEPDWRVAAVTATAVVSCALCADSPFGLQLAYATCCACHH